MVKRQQKWISISLQKMACTKLGEVGAIYSHIFSPVNCMCVISKSRRLQMFLKILQYSQENVASEVASGKTCNFFK